MISQELLEILCCPETHQPLEFAPPATVAQLNNAIAAGTIKNRAGQLVEEQLEGGLMRADHQFIYPVRQGIPVLLIDEAIPLSERG